MYRIASAVGLVAAAALVVWLFVGRGNGDQPPALRLGVEDQMDARSADPGLAGAGSPAAATSQDASRTGEDDGKSPVEDGPSAPPEGADDLPTVESWREAAALWSRGKREQALAGVAQLHATPIEDREEVKLRLLQATMAGALAKPAETLDALAALLETLCSQLDANSAATPTVLSRVETSSSTSLVRELGNIRNAIRLETPKADVHQNLGDPLSRHLLHGRELVRQASASLTIDADKRRASVVLAALDLELWARRVSKPNGLVRPSAEAVQEYRSIRTRFRSAVEPMAPEGTAAIARWVGAWMRSLEARADVYR